jgi:hypothetical protein
MPEIDLGIENWLTVLDDVTTSINEMLGPWGGWIAGFAFAMVVFMLLFNWFQGD